MTRRRRMMGVGATLLAAMSLLVAATYDHLRAAAFIVQAAGMEGVVRTVAEWTTEAVTEREITIPTRSGALRARVYTPGASAAPAALVVPGVHAGGIDEPRLIQFARDIASMGRLVVAAELPDLKAYSITPRSTDQIEDAARWLATGSGYAPEQRVALMGISFAGGLSVVAAGRPSVRDHAALVMSFGGHGDLPRTLRYLCTGIEADGQHYPPHDYGIAIILLGVAHLVVPDEQAAPLREAILTFLNASHIDMWDKKQAQAEFERARRMAEALPEPAKTLMKHVNERDVAALGPILLAHVTELGGNAALSPEKSPPPAAPIYLLHGTGDNVIPASESRLLAEHLRKAGVPVQQLATPLITHAEVDRSAAARAFWDLTRFWASLLDEN